MSPPEHAIGVIDFALVDLVQGDSATPGSDSAMSEAAGIHHASLQYQAHTGRRDHAELRRIPLTPDELRKAAVDLRKGR